MMGVPFVRGGEQIKTKQNKTKNKTKQKTNIQTNKQNKNKTKEKKDLKQVHPRKLYSFIILILTAVKEPIRKRKLR